MATSRCWSISRYSDRLIDTRCMIRVTACSRPPCWVGFVSFRKRSQVHRTYRIDSCTEAPWLLDARGSWTLWSLELADRTVLYLCSHRLHPGIGHQCGWKGEHGQQPGKEAVLAQPHEWFICSLCERRFGYKKANLFLSLSVDVVSFPSAAPRSVLAVLCL